MTDYLPLVGLFAAVSIFLWIVGRWEYHDSRPPRPEWFGRGTDTHCRACEQDWILSSRLVEADNGYHYCLGCIDDGAADGMTLTWPR